MIMAGLQAFSLLSAAWRWGIIIAALVAVVTAYGAWHHKIYRSGYDRAIADIAAEDKRAVDRAIAARGAWKDCRGAGRRWDQVEGRCL